MADKGVPHFNAFAANVRMNFIFEETRLIVLSDTEDRMIVSLFAWTKHRNVTDRQTNR